MEKKQVILIVDDTPENLRVLGDLLEVDYEVRIATNGIDALETVNVSAPDLILLDILMPGMGGYEVCRKLKENPETQIIPIIFISALGMSEQKVEAFSEGAVDYITKPFYTDEVLARVRTHLQLSKMEALKHEIAVRKQAEELLNQQNNKLEAQFEELKVLNEELERTNQNLEVSKARAEENDRLKTAFLQNVSHEIRTPLNGIIGFSDLLQDVEITQGNIVAYTKIIKQSSNRLLETVDNILAISKIETGQIYSQKSSFSLNGLISELFNFYSPLAKEKSISLQYKKNENIIIYTDEFKLHQIFINLINNAIKFSLNGTIDFGFDITNETITCYVKDTGIGISNDMIDIVFERFRQGSFKTTRGYEGAGMGLSICKGYVELLGGTIWIESGINEGTSVYFTIPNSKTNAINQSNRNEPNQLLIAMQGTILIVEDDITSFLLFEQIFERTQCSILHAENGEIAVDLVKKNPDITVILMDMKMSVMDGFEATKIIKKIRPSLPIIAQSAYAFGSEIEKIKSVGCDHYVSKPIKVADLLKIVSKYILSTDSTIV
jgi:signal transduction histidine kinase